MSVERDENGALLCKWIIENFTFARDGLSMTSPKFISSQSDRDFTWSIYIHLNNDFLENGFHCSLDREDDEVMDTPVSYEISVLSGDGSYRPICLETNIHHLEMTQEFRSYSSEHFVPGKDIMGLLKENTLTIYCRIWCKNNFEPNQWLLRTHIATHKKTLKKSLPIDQAFQKKITYWIVDSVVTLFVEFMWIDENLQIQIKQEGEFYRSKLSCVASVLDSTGKSVLSQGGLHCYSMDKDDEWTIPTLVSKKWLSDNRNMCIINDAVNLWVEIEISTMRDSEEVVKIHFGETSTSFAKEMDYLADQNRDSSTANTPTSSLLSGLLSLYQEQRFCDVTIQTRSSSFPTHKTILCAQSPVFTAMFERDMEEKKTGVVKIPDLTDDAVRNMLLFLYSSTLEDLDWDSAFQLFSAANKYEILSLKLVCKNLLKAKLSVENVTEALLLADLHDDDGWKSAVHNFILKKDSEVLNSDMWKEFIKDHAKLAAETMHRIYLQQL